LDPPLPRGLEVVGGVFATERADYNALASVHDKKQKQRKMFCNLLIFNSRKTNRLTKNQ
jgi:hypothetical protein